MMVWRSIAAMGGVLFLSWSLPQRFGADRIEVLDEKRCPTSRVVTAALMPQTVSTI